VESGELDPDRLASWHKLQRELAYLARKQDVRLQAEERRRWARLHREHRGSIRP
jgi:ribosome biogenesis GTPase